MSLVLPDKSTLTYDLYEPVGNEHEGKVFFSFLGLGNLFIIKSKALKKTQSCLPFCAIAGNSGPAAYRRIIIEIR